MVEILKTNASNPDFVALVKKLDAELSVRDGDDHDFYDQYNKLTDIKYVVVAFDNKRPVGCGAIKQFNDNSMEVKRMYVADENRGKGIATLLLEALEKWAKDLGFEKCILETGIRQPEAIALYKKNKFLVIDNYGQYTGVRTSVCFEKQL